MFTPAPGMRVWLLHDGTPSRILNDAGTARWERGGVDFAVETSGPLGLDAIDTDDPATVGCMLAQVEAEAQESVELWHCPDDPPEESGVVFIRARDFASYPGPTRGAALVAAMRAIKAAK